MHQFERGFRYIVKLFTALARTLLKWVTFDQRSRTVTQYPFSSLPISLLTLLLWISALLCPIKMQFDMSVKYALGWFQFEFDKKNQMAHGFIYWFKHHLSFLKFHWTPKLHTNIKQHKVHNYNYQSESYMDRTWSYLINYCTHSCKV